MKKGDTKTLPLVHVEWRDHVLSGSSDNWNSIDGVSVRALTCYSVGYQVAEDGEVIALAQNVGENGTVGEIMTILRSCIVKMEEL